MMGKSKFATTLWLAMYLCFAAAAHADKEHKKHKAAEGALDKYINLDAKDAETKLEVLQHAVYEQEQRVIALQFMLEYGDRVRMKQVLYPSSEQTLIPGYVFTQRSGGDGKRPAIVLVHGGFHEHFNSTWFNLIDTMVAKGYVVIFPEYRGSRGYGENHFRNDYGITDTADVLAAAEYIAAQSFVDPQRLGIVGTSRGGMVTLLAIEQAPKRFKVAADIVGLADFLAYMAYKPEYRRKEVANGRHFEGKLPHENLAAYLKISPLEHVDRIETPLLLLATTGDKIAPVQLHIGRLIDVLKARGKTFEAKIYDNAPGGHIFLHGDSEEQRDAYRRLFDYLGRYLNP